MSQLDYKKHFESLEKISEHFARYSNLFGEASETHSSATKISAEQIFEELRLFLEGGVHFHEDGLTEGNFGGELLREFRAHVYYVRDTEENPKTMDIRSFDGYHGGHDTLLKFTYDTEEPNIISIFVGQSFGGDYEGREELIDFGDFPEVNPLSALINELSNPQAFGQFGHYFTAIKKASLDLSKPEATPPQNTVGNTPR